MIDPLKATKGRRMSKKTRKKTAKTSPGKATRGKSARSAKKSKKSSRAVNTSSSKRKSTRAPGVTAATPRPAARKATPAKPASPSRSLTKSQRPKAAAAAGDTPAAAEGARAPTFNLPRDGGHAVSLADFRGQKLVLFFYPRADTPGCTKEAIDFTRLKGKFAESQTAVLGVSADPPKTQEAFRDKHQLAVPLASDEQHEMLDAYGAWGEKSMYGKTFQGILRTTVLIGADGRVIKIWRNVKVDGHADEVLAAAQTAN
jgi:thioredoxin-dependent peroxiredoxin